MAILELSLIPIRINANIRSSVFNISPLLGMISSPSRNNALNSSINWGYKFRNAVSKFTKNSFASVSDNLVALTNLKDHPFALLSPCVLPDLGIYSVYLYRQHINP